MASSRVAELARNEADEAEGGDEQIEPDVAPETGDEPAGGDESAPDGGEQPDFPAPAPSTEAAASIGPEEIERAEKAKVAQRKKLAGILGSDYVTQECFVCAGLGFIPQAPPDGMTFRVVHTDDGVELLAESPVPEIPLREAPDKETCPECDGIGQVLSGSRNPHARVVGCSKCNGNGWIVKIRAEPAPAAAAGYTSAPPANGGATGAQLPKDAWGRPGGHKWWGVPPVDVPV